MAYGPSSMNARTRHEPNAADVSSTTKRVHKLTVILSIMSAGSLPAVRQQAWYTSRTPAALPLAALWWLSAVAMYLQWVLMAYGS